MKKHFTLVYLMVFSLSSFGQTEPIEKVEIEPDPIIMDSYDYATGRMNDVNWMFKILADDGVRLGFEHKLGNSFSVNLNTKWGLAGLFVGVDNDTRLGIRHYLGHEEKVKLKQQGNNFNGTYVEFGLQSDVTKLFSTDKNPFLSFGLQSRFLKQGLVDAGLILAYNPSSRTIRLRSGFDLGFAISKAYKLKDIEENRCAVVRCFDEQFYMFKTQISRLIDVSYSSNSTNIRFRPNIELEHRISKVGLSMNHELLYIFKAKEIGGQLDYAISEASLRTSIRWYVGKKRRIIKGKTSNNLSGLYIGPIGEIGILSGQHLGLRLKNGEFWSAGFNFGYQTRLLKNLYINFNFGAMYREYFNPNDPLNISVFLNSPADIDLTRVAVEDHIEVKPIGGLVVGYVF